MPIDEIQTVCFVGAGNMGCFNAVKAAISGYHVSLYDLSEESLQQALPRCEGIAAFLAGSAYCAAQDVPAAIERISLFSDLGAATTNADLVSESVFERLDIKRDVLQQLDEICPEHTILTTNSSYLLLSDMEDAVQRGDRVAALHSYMGSPLVDILGGARTSALTLDILERYVRSLSAVPLLLKKEYPGYVLNALLGQVLGAAMRLLAEGAGSVEDIDRAWMQHRSAPMGPLGILDLVGLKLVCDSWEQREDDGPMPGQRQRVLNLLKPFVQRNELGMSTGKGFYQYPEPAYQQSGFLEAGGDLVPLYQPLELALIAGAALVAAAGVAEPADIDKAWRVGTSLDKGPFALLQEFGPELFVEDFKQYGAAIGFDINKAATVVNYVARLT